MDSRYFPVSAAEGGGDILDVLNTGYGVRVIIGDVMGTGRPALETGRELIAAWRAIAATEPHLEAIALRLHAIITRSDHPERFVTAIVLTFTGDSWVRCLCCGHPPPLLLRGGQATFASPFPAAPPLGLLDLADGWCSSSAFPLASGDRLLLYTDGVTEARDRRGRFYPLAERATAAVRASGEASPLLDWLITDLGRHTGSGASRPGVRETVTGDDILLALITRQ